MVTAEFVLSLVNDYRWPAVLSLMELRKAGLVDIDRGGPDLFVGRVRIHPLWDQPNGKGLMGVRWAAG